MNNYKALTVSWFISAMVAIWFFFFRQMTVFGAPLTNQQMADVRVNAKQVLEQLFPQESANVSAIHLIDSDWPLFEVCPKLCVRTPGRPRKSGAKYCD